MTPLEHRELDFAQAAVCQCPAASKTASKKQCSGNAYALVLNPDRRDCSGGRLRLRRLAAVLGVRLGGRILALIDALLDRNHPLGLPSNKT